MPRSNRNLCAVWWQYIYPITALTILCTLGLSFLGLTAGIAWSVVGLLLVFGLFVIAPVTAILATRGVWDSSPMKWLPTGPRVDEPTDELDNSVRALREQYVAGKLTEAEFERRLEHRLEDGEPSNDVTEQTTRATKGRERDVDR